MTTVLKAALAAFAIAGLVTTTNASAMTRGLPCGPRDILAEVLANDFDEEPVSYGITPDGALVEVLVAPNGTWTILITTPGGPSCLLVHGFDWEPERPPKNGPVT